VRTSSVVLTSVLASGAVALLAGCSPGGSQSSPSSLPNSGITESQSGVQGLILREATGVAPKFLRDLRFGTGMPNVRPDKHGAPKLLAVSDFGTDGVDLLNRTYHNTGTITEGLNSCPDGDWVDKSQNLYVASYCGHVVQEYASGATSPTATYSFGLDDPVGVTTDSSSNVYVADYGSGSASSVFEYAQGSNTIANQCPTGLANEGVAVDKSGNVFVSGNSPNTVGGFIVEFKGGLKGCQSTTLGVTLGSAGGLVIEKSGTLAAIDQLAGVDIIPSPYTSISSIIGGFSAPFHDALNKEQNLIFVADPINASVTVLSYPGGTLLQTLGSANGLSDPVGVAAYPQPKK
jgi:DNA-binding beta-propeller fold protein YncE